MAGTPTYEELEGRIKILESKIIELYSPSSEVSENIWSAIFDLFEDIVIQLDKNNLIENVNQAAVNYFNKNKAEIFGHSIFDFLADDSDPNISYFIDNQDKEIFKDFIYLKQGKEKFILTQYSMPQPNKKLLIFHPYQELQPLHQETEIEDKYLSFLHQLPEGIIQTDLAGKILFINEAACQTLGISHAEVIGNHINNVFKIHRNLFFENADNLIQYILSEGNSKSFINNTAIETKSGIIEILFSICPEKYINGSLIGFIISFIDYSDNHKKEKEKKEREERLFLILEKTKISLFEESKNLFIQKLESNYFTEKDINNFTLTHFFNRDSLQRLQDEFSYTYKTASIILDENGNPLTKASNFSTACKILNRNKELNEKCYFIDLALLNPYSKALFESNKCENCQISIKKIPIVANGKEIANWVCGFISIEGIENIKKLTHLQHTGLTKTEIKNLIDTETLPSNESIEKTSNTLWDLCQQLSSICYTCQKLAENHFEKVKLFQELKEAKENAETADKHKTSFLASMSHEIRTPMNAIIGFADLLNDPDFSESEKAEFINLINNNGEILLHLIDDIIDISKIETGELRIEPEECQVNAIINETVIEARDNLKKLGKDNVEIIVSTPKLSEELAILTDPFRFKQILTNLIGNAQKFTHSGSIEIGYKIKSNQLLTGEELFIEFYVKDTGIGIPEEKQSIIFDRFKQADDVIWKKFGGSGLGLTITKRLVNLLGGDIWVNSTPGKGSTFYFTLPYIPVDAKNQYITNSYQKVTNLNLEGKIILVVEDIDSNFNLVRTLLSKTNAQIIWAKDGQQAVDVCRTKKIDLILMDIKLPELNGLLATQRIKEMYKSLPIIAVTAYAHDDDRLAALEAGCSDYITKPIKREHLLYLISKHLNL